MTSAVPQPPSHGAARVEASWGWGWGWSPEQQDSRMPGLTPQQRALHWPCSTGAHKHTQQVKQAQPQCWDRG